MSAPTPFFGFGLLAAFLVLVPLAAVWLHRGLGGAWLRAAGAAVLGVSAAFMGIVPGYLYVTRRLSPGALLAPAHGEWVITRADPWFAVLAAAALGLATWVAVVALYPQRLRAGAAWVCAWLGVAGVAVIGVFFALATLAR